MDLYFERYDGQAATVEDFLACFADSSGRDLRSSCAGTPRPARRASACTASYDDSAKRLTRSILRSRTAPTPGQANKQPVIIPIALGLVGPNGGDIALRRRHDGERRRNARGVFELDGAARRIVVRGVAKPPVPSLAARVFGAGPARSRACRGRSPVLLAHDSDKFNRWQAAQTCATRCCCAAVERIRAGERAARDARTRRRDRRRARAKGTDPAFTAQAMILPSEADIAREIGEDVDPDAIYRAREALRSEIGHALAHALARRSTTRWRPRGLFAGRRQRRPARLAQCALDLIAASDRSARRGARRRAIPQRQQHDGRRSARSPCSRICLAKRARRRSMPSTARMQGDRSSSTSGSRCRRRSPKLRRSTG